MWSKKDIEDTANYFKTKPISELKERKATVLKAIAEMTRIPDSAGMEWNKAYLKALLIAIDRKTHEKVLVI